MYESYYCVIRHVLEIASQCVHEHVIYMHDIVILLLIDIIQYCVASLDVYMYMHMYCL